MIHIHLIHIHVFQGLYGHPAQVGVIQIISQTKEKQIMNDMQEFYRWLSAADEGSSLHQRLLKALTRLTRAQLSHLADELTWFLWSGG